MNYSQIIPSDTVNGIGVRVSLFVSGCNLHCKGCFNRKAWDFDYGEPFDTKTIQTLHNYLQKPYIDGLSILGGEPLAQQPNDLIILKDLCDFTHSIGKNVWLWSGNVAENIIFSNIRNAQYDLISAVDVLVDGQFEEEKRDLRLAFRGSANQRIIDIPATIKKQKIVLYPLDN